MPRRAPRRPRTRRAPSRGHRRAGLAHQLHAGGLRSLVAELRIEAHLGADRKALEVAVQDAVAVEVELPVIAQRADETVALAEELLHHAVRLAVVRLLVVAAQRGGFLQLALDGAEREVDERRHLRRHVDDLLLLLHRQIVLGRNAHLDHGAVAVAGVLRRLLARQGHVAARNAAREALEVLQALGYVRLDPGRAIDAVEDDLRSDLHAPRGAKNVRGRRARTLLARGPQEVFPC